MSHVCFLLVNNYSTKNTNWKLLLFIFIYTSEGVFYTPAISNLFHIYYGVVKVLDNYVGPKASIEKAIIHPRYKTSGRSRNDIALIKVKAPMYVDLEDDEGTRAPINRVCLPKSRVGAQLPNPGSEVTGWGWWDTSNKAAGDLQEVNMTLLSDKDRGKVFASHAVNKDFCLQGVGKGTCIGDSGGPALITVDGQVVQIGVVSRGHQDKDGGCTKGTRSTLFTSVVAYRDWILETMDNN